MAFTDIFEPHLVITKVANDAPDPICCLLKNGAIEALAMLFSLLVHKGKDISWNELARMVSDGCCKKRSAIDQSNAHQNQADAEPLAPLQTLSQEHPGQEHRDRTKERDQHPHNRQRTGRQSCG